MKKQNLIFFILYIFFVNKATEASFRIICCDIDPNDRSLFTVKNSSSEIVLTPNHSTTILHLKAECSQTVDVLYLKVAQIEFLSPSRYSGTNVPLTLEPQINFQGDITSHFKNFMAEKVFFDIPSNNYTHASMQPCYHHSTLGFQSNAALNITPSISFPLPPECAISKLLIQPCDQNSTNSAIHGSIHFSKDFSMDLYLKDASVSLFANKNFEFLGL